MLVKKPFGGGEDSEKPFGGGGGVFEEEHFGRGGGVFGGQQLLLLGIRVADGWQRLQWGGAGEGIFLLMQIKRG